MNVVSCKLHKLPDRDEEEMKRIINETLTPEIKVFRIIEVSRTFDSKDDNNNREYHYILPSFMLQPKSLATASINTLIDTFTREYNLKITPEFHDKL
jgi:tRNA U38,U39,U40 pseudouridine synthase TruA